MAGKQLGRPLRTALTLVAVAMILGAVVLAGLAFHELGQRRTGAGFYARLAQGQERATQEGETAPDPTRPSSQLDFDTLRQTCPDIVGWITIDDSVIDYPIVQGEDDDFYLHHLADQTENPSGAIMMEWVNDSRFGDTVTILHGHNMADDTMFGDLDQYRFRDYYLSHPTITLYTPDGDYEVEIFAAFVVDGEVFGYPIDFATREDFDVFIRKAVSSSRYETGVEVNYGDRILLLSTCAYTFWGARYIVLGKIP